VRFHAARKIRLLSNLTQFPKGVIGISSPSFKEEPVEEAFALSSILSAQNVGQL